MTDEGNREELAEALLGVLATPSNAGPEPIEVAATATATRRRRLIRVALVGWFLLGALWIARPAFIFSPTTGLAVAPVRDEAGLRYAMFLQASRIDEFVDEHARLPSSL
ncbi:MAG: hypothetical protein SGI84_11355, partial [Gemmatimonadota bacterium]|nr:hypothetical protein [Gemmatimonadota bacterium]